MSTISTARRYEIFERDGFRCRLCGRTSATGGELEVDHRNAKASGGDNSDANLWTLCHDCNEGKSDRILPDEKQLRRFSHSLVDTMLECPRKAYYRYVEEIPSPKTAALVKGTACDLAWNTALEVKVARPDQAMPVSDILQATEQAYRDDVRAQGGYTEIHWDSADAKAEARAGLESALRMSRVWAESLYPSIQPSAVQIELKKELPSGRTFIGFVDWWGSWDNLLVMGDNKTSKRAMPQGDADKALQPSAYAWLYAMPDAPELDKDVHFVFARAIDTRQPKAEFVVTTRTPGDVDWYGELVAQVERQYREECWPPNPKSNLCGPKWCPYFERCQPHRTVSGPTPLANPETQAQT